MLTVEKSGVHFAFDATVPPTAQAHSGASVLFETRDCYDGQLTQDGCSYEQMDMDRGNPATGPLYIHEAEPGDVLKVSIQKIILADSGGMCVRKGQGVYDIEGSHCKRFEVHDGHIHFNADIAIPIRPMIGVIGTAPAKGAVSTHTPGEHGGNMDICDLGEGTVLYLPVAVPGALLSMGDLHAIQGDGETAICALELSGQVEVKVEVLKNRADIPTPFIVTKTHYLTTAAHPSLDESSVVAAQKMHRFVQEHSALTDAEAAMLLSLKGNLRISQVVNPAKGCIMDFPIGLVGEDFIL